MLNVSVSLRNKLLAISQLLLRCKIGSSTVTFLAISIGLLYDGDALVACGWVARATHGAVVPLGSLLFQVRDLLLQQVVVRSL